MSDETEAKEAEESTRKLDPELRCMGAILRLLDQLPDAAQVRVMSYLTARFVQDANT